jgi:glycosyltransferase involved in cell wall biosynthesis
LWRLRHPGQTYSKEISLTGRSVADVISRNIDVIWSLQPGVLTDRVPYILTIWDLQHRLQPFFPEVSQLGEWQSRESHYSVTGRKAFFNVVGTQRGADELHQFFGIDQSRLIINPFPCPPPISCSSNTIDNLLQRLSLKPRKFLLYPAQFWPHKNHLGMLLALRLLVDEGINLKLVLSGSDKGCLQSVLRHVNRLCLHDWVVVTGFLERSDLAALYSSCFALVFPSFFGPDNLPPLEAMSYHVPAVVSDVPGALQQYGDSVLRFDPRQPESIASSILRLVNEPGLYDCLVKRGLNLISTLTPSAYVDKIEEYLVEESLPLLCASMLA